jgi:uncharacterized protein
MTVFSPFLSSARTSGNMATTPKTPRPKKGKKKMPQPQRNYRRLISSLLLLSLLVLSLLAVGYVIFFRTVVAGELPQDVVGKGDVGRGAITSNGAPAKRDLPKVAIIIDDLGYNEEIGMELLKFPVDVTYSFLPDAPHSKKLARLAHRRGKTVFLHLPLEPKDRNKDPGPGAIYLADSPEVQKEKLSRFLEQVPYVVGVNNHMGSALTEDRRSMCSIFETLREGAFIFVDSYTTSKSVGLRLSREMGMKSFGRDVFIDHQDDEQSIRQQLDQLFEISKKNGLAVGIAHPRSVTMSALGEFVRKVEGKVEFVGMGDLDSESGTFKKVIPR